MKKISVIQGAAGKRETPPSLSTALWMEQKKVDIL